jgi:hypothetical protein
MFLLPVLLTSLPAFPTVDISEYVNWFTTGFTGFITSNGALLVGAGLIISFVLAALRLIKKVAKSATKG